MAQDGEQRLEWTQAHIDFQQLFEHELEQFVAQQDFSQEEFLAACQVLALRCRAVRHEDLSVLHTEMRNRPTHRHPNPTSRRAAGAQDALNHGSVGTTVSASIVEMVMSTATYDCTPRSLFYAAPAPLWFCLSVQLCARA